MAEADGAPAPFVEPERRFRNLPSSLTTAIDLNRYIFVGLIPRRLVRTQALGLKKILEFRARSSGGCDEVFVATFAATPGRRRWQRVFRSSRGSPVLALREKGSVGYVW